jgi:hypothetical protein
VAVRVKAWKGAWWVFINHQGWRKAKRVGQGPAGRKAAVRSLARPAGPKEAPQGRRGQP